MNSTHEPMTCRSSQPQPVGAFFSKLSPAAMRDLESMLSPADYPVNKLVFSEKIRHAACLSSSPARSSSPSTRVTAEG